MSEQDRLRSLAVELDDFVSTLTVDLATSDWVIELQVAPDTLRFVFNHPLSGEFDFRIRAKQAETADRVKWYVRRLVDTEYEFAIICKAAAQH